MHNIEKSIHSTASGAAYRGYGADGSIFRITRSTSSYGNWIARNEKDANDILYGMTLKALSKKLKELGTTPRTFHKNPVGFESCAECGGRVRTKKLPGGRYIHICFKGHKSFASEVHHKNPAARFVIFARKGRGELMHYNGRNKFSSTGPIRVYADWMGASDTRERLMREYPVLHKYSLTIKKLPARYRRNPESRELRQAEKLLTDFSGHEPSEIVNVKDKSFKTGLAVGPLLGIAYETVRDGETLPYFHEFRKSSRPLLAASSDGKALRIVGGRFQFTQAGITDR